MDWEDHIVMLVFSAFICIALYLAGVGLYYAWIEFGWSLLVSVVPVLVVYLILLLISSRQ